MEFLELIDSSTEISMVWKIRKQLKEGEKNPSNFIQEVDLNKQFSSQSDVIEI